MIGPPCFGGIQIRERGPTGWWILESEIVKCDFVSRGTRTWEWLRCRRPASIVNHIPVLPSERILRRDYNPKCWVGKKYWPWVLRGCHLQFLLDLASAFILRSDSTGLMTTLYSLRFESPPTWSARSPYLYPPGTGYSSYTYFFTFNTYCISDTTRIAWKHSVRQFICCCLCIHWRGNMFAKPLPGNLEGGTRSKVISEASFYFFRTGKVS
jgi:hypothetical protein